jgi:hypothetical protein
MQSFLIEKLCLDLDIKISEKGMAWKKTQRKMESRKNVQNDKIENDAGSVWLSLFMDVTGKLLESASYRQLPRTGISRVQH